MGDDAFDGPQLAEKLSKLNSSQQSIESLSRWCISYRKKAKQIVETWDKSFRSAQREQRVSFLYLANDIIQNSRRRGSEFVNEFWKVLPASLKQVYETGDESGKKVASRLVDIWEERKVFGSRGQNLKDEVLGKSPAPSVSNGKSSNPIKVVKKDAHSVRIKLAVGCTPEKIVTAFQLVHDENVNEEDALNKCKHSVFRVGEMENDIENRSSQGNLQGSELMDKLLEQENILQQCISHFENAESLRITLISLLKDALQDQESKLELLRSGMQVACGQIELVKNARRRLTSPSVAAPPVNTGILPIEVTRTTEPIPPSVQLINIPPLPPPPNPVTSFTNSKTNEEESKRSAAAAVAAKLAASTSSAQMLTSVLSSLVAEEAASLSSGLKSTGFTSSLPFASPEKRLKLDKPMTFSDMKSSERGSSTYFTSSQQLITSIPLAPSSAMQSVSQPNQIQAPFPPPPPPPPSLHPANSPASQLVQSTAMMMGVMPYGYSAGLQQPLSSQIAMGLRPPPPPPQQAQQQQQLQTQQPQSQQQPANGGYYRPPGIGFYGQAHQQTAPAAPRQ
ncbi:regulation of nuclear pre-mRNA domain-containing protein 1B-like [Solanum tuberosum]|uniref:regulation of nuclear pre-mRNA domain-containing protein 1B-like n=1 Tax=Solanum tuberosum TaxID=4113 RepID=UPI0003D290F6|nr:PREDICTED: regulation of nuclear pre-mRNA domain-containing protein 1B-like [Solanum tuberosum]XP_015166380.1 PREDICTED: regulation of nuclear pre-mRNA domain-containing protein 1B-like [Solanum tuberosum]